MRINWPLLKLYSYFSNKKYMKIKSINKSFLRMALPVIVLAMLVMPMMVFAQVGPPDLPGDPTGGEVGIDLGDIETLIEQIGQFLITLGVLIAVVMIVVAGIRYMMAGGDPTKAADARKMLINGLIGAAIILGVGILLATVQDLLINIGGGSGI